MAAEKYQRTVGYPSTSWASCLLRCSRYSEARSDMKNYIYEICLTDNKKRHLKLTDSVLLAPAWDSSITKKADREFKHALFQFLKTVNRKV